MLGPSIMVIAAPVAAGAALAAIRSALRPVAAKVGLVVALLETGFIVVQLLLAVSRELAA